MRRKSLLPPILKYQYIYKEHVVTFYVIFDLFSRLDFLKINDKHKLTASLIKFCLYFSQNIFIEGIAKKAVMARSC
jgi:hypothetical protein